MNQLQRTKYTKPIIYGILSFIGALALTQYIAWEQKQIVKAQERRSLQRELSHVKGIFYNILTSDIVAAKTLATIYKSYGIRDIYDSLASQIVAANPYIEAIQITENDIVRYIYPSENYPHAVGFNTSKDSLHRYESAKAFSSKVIYFAGPRPLMHGGVGIIGKAPIIINNTPVGLSVVLTKLSTIREALEPADSTISKFSYTLTKYNTASDTNTYQLSALPPGTYGSYARTVIPEGDWILTVSFNNTYVPSKYPFIISMLGILLSLTISYLIYRIAGQRYYLHRMVEETTSEITRKEKYYRTLIESSSDAIVLYDKDGNTKYRNPASARITGYSLEELKGIKTVNIVHPDDQKKDFNEFLSVMNTPNGILHKQHRLKHKSGKDIYIDGIYRNMLDDDVIHAIVYTYADVTEQVLAYQQLEKAQHDLEERVKELSTIYNVNTILQKESATADELFTQIVNILPQGWQYTADCEARILFYDKTYSTPGFIDTPFKQWTVFRLQNGKKGLIEVVYTKEKPLEYEGCFLKEERDLINTVADTITIYFNKKLQERILKESEARFRGAFEFAAVGMAITAMDGRWLMVNHALADMLGYTEDELLQTTFMKVTHSDDVNNNLDAIHQMIEGETSNYRTEKRYIHKNGNIIWGSLNVSIIRNEASEPLYFVSQINNITEQVESQMKFRSLVERSLVGVYIIQNGKFAYANPELIKEFGYSEEELLTRNFTDLIYPADIPIVTDNATAREKAEIDYSRYEVRALRKNGDLVWIEVFGSDTILNGAPAVIGTIINITQYKIDELERQNIIQDLEQRNRDLEQFSYILSHNVRAPLTTILGMASLIDKEMNEEDSTTIIDGIKASAGQLDEIIRDLNTILSIKHSLSEIKTIVSLEEITNEISNMLADTIVAKKATIKCDFSAAPYMNTIRPYMKSIFYNMISNALKYMRPDVPPEINISSVKKDGKIILKFKDNGIGIDLAKHNSQIFGLYKRFHPHIEGKGLGLYIVKTQANALQGSIDVTSEPNKGTEFIFTFNDK